MSKYIKINVPDEKSVILIYLINAICIDKNNAVQPVASLELVNHITIRIFGDRLIDKFSDLFRDRDISIIDFTSSAIVTDDENYIELWSPEGDIVVTY